MSERIQIDKGPKGYRFFKRLFDITFSLIALLLLSPLILILALIIPATSKGSPFFRDIRVGRGYKIIGVFKFRTMVSDAQKHPEKYLNEAQMKQWKEERKVDNDPRLTKFGRFLRKTSIDEIPQFLNILFGSMSFVGPRPITEFELEKHFTDEEKTLLLSCRPGLIGVWAVNGRSDVSFESGERQKLELSYLEKRSLWFDLKILFKTIPAVLGRKGAE